MICLKMETYDECNEFGHAWISVAFWVESDTLQPVVYDESNCRFVYSSASADGDVVVSLSAWNACQ